MEIGSDYNIIFKNSNKNSLFYFSGRLAIKSILKKIKSDKEECLIPNYLCESIFRCFSNYDFYKIDNNLNIDIEYLKNKIKNKKYKVIFIINYFGYIDDNIYLIIDLCKKNNIIIIEDFTHNIYSEDLYGDISLCSYRKSLSTPFGAIVIDKNKILNINQVSIFNLKYIIITLYKLIGMYLKNYISLKNIWRPILLKCEKNIDEINYYDFDFINNFFYQYYYDKSDINIRKKNIEYLNNNLKIDPTHKFKKTYFTFPVFFKNKEIRDEMRNILIENKIYCPIYWPLNFDIENKCNTYISDRILCIPIDQRYNREDMKRITLIINNNIN